ncbi:indole-3-glycerol phosphate synthase TrpC [Micrococcales bacterium 31B]|nr:indole-3-glycerol phosphate synthase TrpC [Micrococcales bacterium 31B]
MSVLDDIIAGVRLDLAERQRTTSEAALLDAIAAREAQHGGALEVTSRLKRASGVQVIAEVKRKSPSKGHLAEIADPAALASEYETGGAAAVSVLTEQRRFNGSLADLDAVRERISIPILRKDFIVEPYQVLEARAHGADLVLLIVAGLAPQQLAELHEQITALGMTTLVEVHEESELDAALACPGGLIGVNARNLKTLEVDNDTFGRLVGRVPADRVRVAESGIGGPADVARFASEGADAVLIGEALVKGNEPQQALQNILAAGRRTA